ncbi:GTP-binding translation elongation factor [Chlorella virus XW01]|nr:GTP-binding translation elongation factor [Chlorella virus XW01]
MDDLTIVVCGNVDAGKSTLIGVLTTGELDDGRGKSRNNILIHPHERETGRTSNITYNPIIYKFNKDGVYLNAVMNGLKTIKNNKNIKILDNDYTEKGTRKTVSFVDLAGHEKYLKTTLYGLTGLFPDYGLLVINANAGITRITKEHLGILLYLRIPIIITITKIDFAPIEVYKNLLDRIKKLIKNSGFNKVIYNINMLSSKTNENLKDFNNNDDTNKYLDMINTNDVINLIPVISVSNKEGTNINNLHNILINLKKRRNWLLNDGSIVYLDAKFNIPNIGIVVSGTVKGNVVNIKQKMYLGPFNGQFKEVIIKSIHNNVRESVDKIENNSNGCFAIKGVKDTINRGQIKKGMVLIDSLEKYENNISNKFKAKIDILHHSTSIKNGYSPVIHCGPIRQPALMVITDDKKLRSGDKEIVIFNFVSHPEFLEKNNIFFFRDGNTKGVGEILEIL